MRLALISDLHANVPALEAVLKHARSLGVDQIICLGDVATLGPDPGVLFQMLRDVGCPCVLGNHDEFLLDEELIHTYTEAPIIVQAVAWCRERLGEQDLSFLRSFKRSFEVPLEGGKRLLLYHGSPRSHMDDVLATTPKETLDMLFEGHTAAVMAGGHTHIQMLRQYRGILLVNPGSVGMPFQEYVHGGPPTLLRHAEYATITSDGADVSVALHRVEVDIGAVRAAVSASDNPLRGMLLQQYA